MNQRHELQEFAGTQERPDGRFAMSGSADITLKLWGVSGWTKPSAASAEK